MKFRHERLDVYNRSIEFLAFSFTIINKIPKGYGFLGDQIKRASLSIPLNIAEGNSKFSNKETTHFLQIARASANECSAILASSVIIGIINKEEHQQGKSLLYEIVCMLSKMVTKH